MKKNRRSNKKLPEYGIGGDLLQTGFNLWGDMTGLGGIMDSILPADKRPEIENEFLKKVNNFSDKTLSPITTTLAPTVMNMVAPGSGTLLTGANAAAGEIGQMINPAQPETTAPQRLTVDPRYVRRAKGGPIMELPNVDMGTDMIPTGPNGTPSISSGQQPVAYTDAGEVVWNSKVFSKDSGYADKAKRIMKNYKLRLGDTYSKEDRFSRKAMDNRLEKLYQEQEAEKMQQEEITVPKLAKGGDVPWYNNWSPVRASLQYIDNPYMKDLTMMDLVPPTTTSTVTAPKVKAASSDNRAAYVFDKDGNMIDTNTNTIIPANVATQITSTTQGGIPQTATPKQSAVRTASQKPTAVTAGKPTDIVPSEESDFIDSGAYVSTPEGLMDTRYGPSSDILYGDTPYGDTALTKAKTLKSINSIGTPTFPKLNDVKIPKKSASLETSEKIVNPSGIFTGIDWNEAAGIASNTIPLALRALRLANDKPKKVITPKYIPKDVDLSAQRSDINKSALGTKATLVRNARYNPAAQIAAVTAVDENAFDAIGQSWMNETNQNVQQKNRAGMFNTEIAMRDNEMTAREEGAYADQLDTLYGDIGRIGAGLNTDRQKRTIQAKLLRTLETEKFKIDPATYQILLKQITDLTQ